MAERKKRYRCAGITREGRPCRNRVETAGGQCGAGHAPAEYGSGAEGTTLSAEEYAGVVTAADDAAHTDPVTLRSAAHRRRGIARVLLRRGGRRAARAARGTGRLAGDSAAASAEPASHVADPIVDGDDAGL